MIPKLLPTLGYDADGHIRPEQEEVILRMVEEFTTGTHAVVNGSNMDTGKTVQSAEVSVRMGWQRVLFIGVKDTFNDIAARFVAQSDGAIQMRRIDATKAGQVAFADYLAGAPGYFFTGTQYLTAQDWKYANKMSPFEPEKPITKYKGRVLGSKAIPSTATFVANSAGVVEKTQTVKIRTHKNIYKKVAPVDAIIFDEIHAVASKHSLGIRTLRTIKSHNKLGMSGTWVGNKFRNAWTISQWAWPELIDASSVSWEKTWCTSTEVVGAGGKVLEDRFGNPILSWGGEKNPGEFVKTLPCYIRLEGEEKVPAPELVYVKLTPEQREDYKAIEEQGLVYLEQHPGLAPLVTNIPIATRGRLRSATLGVMSLSPWGDVFFDINTESTKLAALRQVVDRPSWRDKRVVIYTEDKRFVKVTVARMQRAGYNAVEWSGDVSSKRRDEIKAGFLAGEIQYIVAVISSFGTGLDGFQRVCNRVIWLSRSENKKDNQQAVRRIFRTGVEDFRQVELVAEDTYDLGIFHADAAHAITMQQTLAA